MRKNLLRMAFAATLVCSVVLLMSCSDNDDTADFVAIATWRQWCSSRTLPILTLT